MYLELNFFSFMGLPDSPVFLPDKDLHAMDKECNFLSRPMQEFEDVCQIAPLKEVEIDGEDQRVSEFCQEERRGGAQREEDHEEKEDRNGRLLSSLKVKLPSPREVVAYDEVEEDGLTTPTSSDHKIPLVCPPPPRKPKPVPSTNRKGSRRRVLLDLSNEIESLFPPALLADFGNKIKKVRKESVVIP